MKKIVLLLGLAFALVFGASLEEANKAYKDKKYNVAFPIYEKLANSGDADAQYKLGMMYGTGKGVKQDKLKAIEWIEKAAKQGDVDTQHKLGNMYLTGYGGKKDYLKAFEWYEKSASQGHADSQYMLGKMYLNGDGVKQDNLKAKEYFKKACDGGSIMGCESYKTLNQ